MIDAFLKQPISRMTGAPPAAPAAPSQGCPDFFSTEMDGFLNWYPKWMVYNRLYWKI
jgi:hypothetical protein